MSGSVSGGAVLREATTADAPALARLRWAWRTEDGRTEGLDEAVFTDAFVDWWQRRERHVGVVATDGDPAVGMGFVAIVDRVPEPGAPRRRHGDLQSVYVAPSHRNRGIGGQLVGLLVARARELGCLRVTVHSSARATSLYERLGFERSDRLLVQRLDA